MSENELDGMTIDDAVTRYEGQSTLLERIEITRLFGRYNYMLEVPPVARSDRLMLLYADNGKGKTTVLRLLWHLLSPSNDRRHRANIQNIPFESIRIELSDGAEIRASRVRALEGPYVLRLRRGGITVSEAEWPPQSNSTSMLDGWTIEDLRDNLDAFPEDLQRAARAHIARQIYLEYLSEIGARPYFLADDRNIYSDDLEDPAVVRERQAFVRRPSGERPRTDEAQTVVAQELLNSMRRANEMLRQLTLGGTASGSASANTVYLDVLHRLGSAARDNLQEPRELRHRLNLELRELGERSREFEVLGLVPNFASHEFVDALAHLPAERLPIAEEVLAPYLASLSARLDALQDAQSLVRTFLDETNGFLVDKQLHFSPRTGLTIQLQHESVALAPAQLSSGERQLVLLLCNALLARQGTRLFLIDEPELSLNAKWQRKVVRALLACTAGTSVQFLIATHSLELLSSYRSNVVHLVENESD